ncbi:MAG: CoA transferase, partial [Gammaproteobacteria bacterium]
RPELAAAELYGDQRKRLAARETVDALVIDWVASLERQVILDRCLEMEVPAGKVNSIADIFDDEHFQARENLLSREAEGLGDVVVPGVVPRLSKTPGRVTHLGPTLGDATVAVLTGLLQLNAAEIAALRDKKII